MLRLRILAVQVLFFKYLTLKMKAVTVSWNLSLEQHRCENRKSCKSW